MEATATRELAGQAAEARADGPPCAALLRSWIAANAERRGAEPYIVSIDQGVTLTHAELARAADRLAGVLAEAGIGANDRVAMMAGNSVEHLIAYVGVMAAGATICTVHVETNQAHLTGILKALRPRMVLVEDGLGLDLPKDAAPDALWLPLGRWGAQDGHGLMGRLRAGPPARAGRPASSQDDTACIYFTSGTTATPKGVALTYRELLQNAGPTARAFGMTDADRILDFRPFNWASAQILGALSTLAVGATLLLARKFSRSRFFGWLREHRATIATGNPTTINMLLSGDDTVTARDLPDLRFVTSSSAPLALPEWKRFEERFGIPVAQGCGTSETGWIAGSTDATRRPGSVGRPLGYHAVRIVDAAGTPLPVGEIGFVELGEDPGREYRYLTEDGTFEVTAVGRYRTGDLGYLDADGYLFITGREKDLIIRGGINIAPLEIDAVLLDMPGLVEAATVGVPDPVYGEEVVCFVVPRAEAGITEAAVLDFCRARLPAFKAPKRAVLRDALPKTDRGKMNRRALVEAWEAEGSQG